jgi:hypothetical protein
MLSLHTEETEAVVFRQGEETSMDPIQIDMKAEGGLTTVGVHRIIEVRKP